MESLEGLRGYYINKLHTQNEAIISALSWDRYIRNIKDVADDIPENGKVLDIGCGDGHTTLLLKLMRPDLDVTGIDMDPTMMEIWKNLSHYGCTFMIMNGENISFSDGEFDSIMQFGVLEHVGDEQKFLEETFRILKKNGSYHIFDLPNRGGLSENILGKMIGVKLHDRQYTKKSIGELLEKYCSEIRIENCYILPSQMQRFNKYLGNMWDKYYPLIGSVDNFLMKTFFKRFSQSLKIRCRSRSSIEMI